MTASFCLVLGGVGLGEPAGGDAFYFACVAEPVDAADSSMGRALCRDARTRLTLFYTKVEIVSLDRLADIAGGEKPGRAWLRLAVRFTWRSIERSVRWGGLAGERPDGSGPTIQVGVNDSTLSLQTAELFLSEVLRTTPFATSAAP